MGHLIFRSLSQRSIIALFQISSWTSRLGSTPPTVFDPVGVFGANQPEPPTCASVLAFMEVRFLGVVDPVLYRGLGVLPVALKRLD